MTRNLKVLGLALCAAFAMSAVAAGSAWAVNHTFTNDGPGGVAYLEAETEPGSSQDFEATTGESKVVKCSEISVNASDTGTSGRHEITVEPHYNNCGVYETGEPGVTEKIASATINTEDCHYKFTGETTPGNPTGNEHASVHLENGETEGKPTCEHIKINVTSFQVNCIDVPVQEVADAVRYENIVEANGKKAVVVHATAHSIKSTTTNNNLFCPTETGGTVVHSTETSPEEKAGSYTSNTIVRGYNNEAHGEQVNVTFE